MELDSEEENPCHIVKKGRGRMYIPHGNGKEEQYRPHTQHIDVEYSECGPDWSSKIRRIPSPKPEDNLKETAFYPPLDRLRHFPGKSNARSTEEYIFYPTHGIPLVYKDGKVTYFDGVHLASKRTYNEITDIARFGRKGLVYDPRGGFKEHFPGDKPYHKPEYSTDFHKFGSTRPVVNFGGGKEEVADTFIPLQPLPPYPVKPYKVLNAERLKQEEIDEVSDLEDWRPASQLKAPSTDSK